jgi:glyoxylase-like metal-dependent hydrolase (beta-lactamase superfamily II)
MIVQLPIGILQSNCYLVYDEACREGIIADPGASAAALLKEIKQRDLQIRYILNTHGHFDHIIGNAQLVAELNVPLGIHPDDQSLLSNGGGAAYFGMGSVSSPPATLALTDGFTLQIGKLNLRVIHTPGHTPGSVCFFVSEDTDIVRPSSGPKGTLSPHGLITGDTLFAGSVGRTDLPGGNAQTLTKSLNRLLALPPETPIYPGHGPTSTLAQEQRSNPWLKWASR